MGGATAKKESEETLAKNGKRKQSVKNEQDQPKTKLTRLSDSEIKAVGVLRELLPGQQNTSEEATSASRTLNSKKAKKNRSKMIAKPPPARASGFTARRRKSNCHFCEPLGLNCGLVAGKCPNRPCSSCGGRHRLGRCKKSSLSNSKRITANPTPSSVTASTPVSSGTLSPAESPSTSPSPSPNSETTKAAAGSTLTFGEKALGAKKNGKAAKSIKSGKKSSKKADDGEKKPRRVSKKPQLKLDTSESALDMADAPFPPSSSPANFSFFGNILSPSSSPAAADFLRASGLLGMANLPSPTAATFAALLSPINATPKPMQGFTSQNTPMHLGSSQRQGSHFSPDAEGQHKFTFQHSGDSHSSNHNSNSNASQLLMQPPSPANNQNSMKSNDAIMNQLLMPLATPSGFNSFPFSFPNTPMGSSSSHTGNMSINTECITPYSPTNATPTASGKTAPDDLIAAAQAAVAALSTPKNGQSTHPTLSSGPSSSMSPPSSSGVGHARSSKAKPLPPPSSKLQRKRPNLSIDTGNAAADFQAQQTAKRPNTGNSNGKASTTSTSSGSSSKSRQYSMLRKKSACHFCSEIGKNCGLVAGKCPNRPCAKCNGRHRHGRCRLRPSTPAT